MRTVLIVFLTLFVAVFSSPYIVKAVDSRPVSLSAVTGGDETYIADVVLDAGIKKLAVLATAVIEQVFGKPGNAWTWGFFGNTAEDANGIGSAGDQVTVVLPAAPTPLDTVYPAVSVTYTIVAADVASSNPEKAVATKVCDALKADGNFDTSWKCQVIKDFGGIYIQSKLFNEWGERSTWSMTCTGTTICNVAESAVRRYGGETQLVISPDDPRIGQLGISGTIQVASETVSNIIVDTLKDSGGTGSSDMTVNGSVTPVKFEYNADQTGSFDFIIQKISCFCQGNGIQFGKYCNIASVTNGMLVEFTSEGINTQFAVIRQTDNYKHVFSIGDPTQFGLDIQSGADDLMATAVFNPPIILEASSGDEVAITIRDNFTSVGSQECRVFGFKKAI